MKRFKTPEDLAAFLGRHPSRERRDWGEILGDLAAAGVSVGNVAQVCCRTVGTVTAWARGGEPKETDARLVLALYAKRCPALYAAHQTPFAIRPGPG